MENRASTARAPLGEEGHSAYIALGEDELRRWETACRGLEEGDVHAWPAEESRALIKSILGCLFGEDFSQLEAPSRAWARTNSTMAIFTRRLGCLRELVGQESMMNGPDSSDRLQEIFDKVTIVATEAVLASLAYPNVPTGDAGEATIAESQLEVGNADQPTAEVNARSPRRRRILAGLLAVAVTALVISLVSEPSSPRVHHPGGSGKPVHVQSNKGTSPAKTTSGNKSSPTKSGTVANSAPRSSSPTSPGGTNGSSGTGSKTTPGTGGLGNANANTGSTSPNPGGSATVTLPGGGLVTLPPVTVP